MMCNISSEQLVFFMDGNVTPEEKAALHAHISACPSCQERLSGFQALEGSLQELGQWIRLREAAHQQFKSMRRQEKALEGNAMPYRRWVPALGVVIAAILLCSLFISNSHQPKILRVAGQVTLPHANRVSLNETLETAEGYVAMRMGDGRSEVEFGPNTQVVIQGPRELYVEKGVVWNKVAPDPANPYRIVTPFGNITVLGTQFEVEVGKTEAGVRVLHGTVELHTLPSATASSLQKITTGYAGKMLGKSNTPPTPVDTKAIAPWRRLYQSEIKTSDIAKTVRNAKP